MTPFAHRQSTDAPRPVGLQVGLWPALAATALAPLTAWLSGGLSPGAAALCGLFAALPVLAAAMASRPEEPTPSSAHPVAATTVHSGHADSLASLLRATLPAWIRHVGSARSHAQQGMDQLAQSFSALDEQLAATFQSAPSKALVEQILTDLQSQDRMGQMLGCVTDDMLRLQRVCEGADDPASTNPEHWLARLEDSYPMEDMRAEHSRREATAPAASVEFF